MLVDFFWTISSVCALKTTSESFDSFEPKCVTTRTKRLIFHTFLSHFVRVLTRYGSNESNDSLGFLCVGMCGVDGVGVAWVVFSKVMCVGCGSGWYASVEYSKSLARGVFKLYMLPT